MIKSIAKGVRKIHPKKAPVQAQEAQHTGVTFGRGQKLYSNGKYRPAGLSVTRVRHPQSKAVTERQKPIVSSHEAQFGKTGSWKRPVRRTTVSTENGVRHVTTLSRKHVVAGTGITAVGAWGQRGTRSQNKHPQTRGY